MKIKVWGVISVCLIILAVYSYNSISTLDTSVNKLNDSIFNINEIISNNKFSENADIVSNSTILVLIKEPKQGLYIGQLAGDTYVDENGKVYGKGTAFSIGDGIILTASHVIEGVDPTKIVLVWNGKEHNRSIISIKMDLSKDFAILKTNLNIPPVKSIIYEKSHIGAKIGFVGFPLNEKTLMLNDGVISSIRNEDDGYFWYTINSFVNRGNSGGPVFLADTGEIIGFVSSRQSEGIAIPQLDTSKMTEGEKQLMELQMFMAIQLASNSQAGIGQIIGLNQRVIDAIKIEMN